MTAVAGHPLVDEVIVVDDGSTDDTVAVVRGFPGVRLLRLPRNGGKSAAVFAGLDMISHAHVLMLDADLQGLDAAAITGLLEPVVQGRADVAISLRGNAPGLWRLIGLDYISGERVLPRAMLVRIAHQWMPRFGIEVALNRLWVESGARIAVVGWPGVRSPSKAAKRGFRAGLAADLGMIGDLCATIPAHRLAAQIGRMRRQRVA